MCGEYTEISNCVFKTILNSFVKDFGYFHMKMAGAKFRSGPC